MLASLAAALLFGAGTPLAKSILQGTSPWLLAALLYLGSGLGQPSQSPSHVGGTLPAPDRDSDSRDGLRLLLALAILCAAAVAAAAGGVLVLHARRRRARALTDPPA